MLRRGGGAACGREKEGVHPPGGRRRQSTLEGPKVSSIKARTAELRRAESRGGDLFPTS